MGMNDFDQYAQQWDQEQRRQQQAADIAEVFVRNIEFHSQMRILDYGAGTGMVLLKIQPYVKEIVAADTSQGMLEVLRQKLKDESIQNVQTIQWNIEEDELLDPRFDLIISTMTLHHIPNIPQVLRRFYELLKPKGQLAIADLDKEEGDFHREEQKVPHAGFARESFRAMLLEAGFTFERFQTASTVVKKNKDNVDKEYSIFLALSTKERDGV